VHRLVEILSRFVSAEPADPSDAPVYSSAPIGRAFVAFTVALAATFAVALVEVRQDFAISPSGLSQLGVVATTTFFLAALAVGYRAMTTSSPALAPIALLLLLPCAVWCWYVLVQGSSTGMLASTIVTLAVTVVGVTLLVEGLVRARWLGVFCGLGAAGLTMAVTLVHNNPDTRQTLSLALLACFSGIACMYGTLVEIESTGRRSFEELLDAKRKIQAEISQTEDLLHDLRSGLLSIEVAMASLDDDIGEPLRTETARLRTLTAKRKRQPHEFDMVPGIRDMVKARRSTGVNIDLRAPTSAQILGEESEVMAIVDNLLSNAMRHGADPVYVDIEEHNGRVQVKVTDSGTITEPVQTNGFFKRGFSSHKDGEGIGLARAQMLAELHNGTVVYEPGDNGKTSFVLTLPNSETAEAKDKETPKVVAWSPVGR